MTTLEEAQKKVDEEIEKLKAELKEKKYPDGLIKMGEARFRGWVEGVARMVDHRNPNLMAVAMVELLPEARESTKRYVEKYYEALTR